jgi:hypothetical protein
VGGSEEVSKKINGRNYRLDILDDQGTTIYEIQRSNFGGRFSEKIISVLNIPEVKLVIVHPVVLTQKVTRMYNGEIISTNCVNKRGDIYSFFEKLVSIKTEFIPKRMEFEILFIKEHVFKEFVGFWKRSGRRRYKTVQRDLLSIQNTRKFLTRSDFIQLLPKGLPEVFTNRDLADRLVIQGGERRKRRISGCLTYSLCKLGILSRVGTRRRSHEFSIRIHT